MQTASIRESIGSGMTRVIGTIEELLAGVESSEPLVAADGKSGVLMERVSIAGHPHVVKYLSLDDDWIMRITGDRRLRPLQVWEAGIYDSLPPCIDHAVVGMGLDDPSASRATARLAILMRDVSPHLVPEGDDQISLEQHRSFLDHMASLHAAYWGWTDEFGLLPLEGRYLWFAPARLKPELARADCVLPVKLADEGWRRFARLEPSASRVVFELHGDPTPIIDALAVTPHTFLHGDWKMGNLGTAPDGRTILIDWAVAGGGPGCSDLVHYLLLNRARLPESKEASIDVYRSSLERLGIVTEPWWDRQLPLCLLGGVMQFGWEKSLGDGDEIDIERRWWCDRALEAHRWLA